MSPVDPRDEDVPYGVVEERLGAYLAAKRHAPRNALPSDLLQLAAFLAAIDREEPEEPEEDEETESTEFEDDRTGAAAAVVAHDEDDDETPGFEPVEGRDEWPPAVAWMRRCAPPGFRLVPWQKQLLTDWFAQYIEGRPL
jgi:hypothetical protein